MALGDDLIEAVVTCEGNLYDPDFSERFKILLGNLKSLLREDERVKVKKIEPWNSVRVTISIPTEAAQKLKVLAQQGSQVLKSLGILTVQVEGDKVISLTLVGQNQPTELIVSQDGPSSSTLPELPLPSTSSSSGQNVPIGVGTTNSSAFRSPNVVAPAGESIPVLPPKTATSRGPQFPFASMAHAAQTMQRTDHPNATSTQINNHSVNSTNFPNVPSPSPSLSNPLPITQSVANLNSVNNSGSGSSSTSQGVGGLKSEQLNSSSRFVFPRQAEVPAQSQSLQLQIVNAPPPPYPGVNSGNNSDVNGPLNERPLLSQNNNSANLQINAAESSQSVTFVGAPPPAVTSTSSSNVTLARSVSSPASSSATTPPHPLIISDALLGQQPMSSPLLVNLLQNNELLQSSSQGIVNIMLPPGSTLEQKKLILQQHLQQRKIKRGMSLDGASSSNLGEAGITAVTTTAAAELSTPLSAGGTERASPLPAHSQDTLNNNNQLLLPSSEPIGSAGGGSSRIASMNIGQPRPSSDLTTTATIIQGRTIIHQGNVRVFNSGQIRAIRFTQANSSSNIQFIQGKPVMTMSSLGEQETSRVVFVNGPHSSSINVADQSSRTFFDNPPQTQPHSSPSGGGSGSSSTFIPPPPPPSDHSSFSSSSRNSAPPAERHAVVQSHHHPHEAKIFPSQRTVRGLNPAKPSGGKPRQLLINPLTGHLEPMPSEESSSDSDEEVRKKKTGDKPRRSSKASSESLQHQQRQQIVTTTTGVTVARVVKPVGNEHRKMTLEDRKQPLQNRLTVVPVTISSPSSPSTTMGLGGRKSSRDEGGLGIVTITSKEKEAPSNPEKIKLRLKLEKSEPVAPAYKVDVSFVKKSEKGFASPATSTSSSSFNPLMSSFSSGASTSSNTSLLPATASLSEQPPRVPPLHISLRGKHSAVVVSSPRREEESPSLNLNLLEGKPSSTGTANPGKIGKRTKSRAKSSNSGIDSDPELGRPPPAKNPKMSSRPRKDSNDSAELLMIPATLESLKGRLVEQQQQLHSQPLSVSGGKPLAVVAAATAISVMKDLKETLFAGSAAAASTSTPTPIPPPTVKLKGGSPESLDSPVLPGPKTPTLDSIVLDSSSLLFQHLLKKEDTISPMSPGTAASATGTLTQVQMSTTTTSTSTSVLTLTSTPLGAPTTVTTAHGISVADTVSITSVSSPPVQENLENVICTSVTNVSKLKRDNHPIPLDIYRGKSGLESEPKRSGFTPTSKSPKPIPELLALNLPTTPKATTTAAHVVEAKHSPPNLTVLELEGEKCNITEEMSQSIPSPAPTTPLASASEILKQIISTPLQVSPPDDPLVQHVQVQDVNCVSQKSLPSPKQNVDDIAIKPPSTGISSSSNQLPTASTTMEPTANVDISTSADSELSSLSSASLRELLEKESNVLKGEPIQQNLQQFNNESPLITDICDLNDCPKIFSTIVNHVEIPDSNDKVDPSDPVMTTENVEVMSPDNIDNKIITSPPIIEETCPLEQNVQEITKIMFDEPLPSTVTPNALPISLPNAEEPSGLPGEDSGIDSMDALSEKSPNQGESPVRKEVEHCEPNLPQHVAICPPATVRSPKPILQESQSCTSTATGAEELKDVESDAISFDTPQVPSSSTAYLVDPPDPIVLEKVEQEPEQIVFKPEQGPEFQTKVDDENQPNNDAIVISNSDAVPIVTNAAATQQLSIQQETAMEVQEHNDVEVHATSPLPLSEPIVMKEVILQEAVAAGLQPNNDSESLKELNLVDAIQELNQQTIKPQIQHMKTPTVQNVKVRRAKLENIVAAIGTKNKQNTPAEVNSFVSENFLLPAKIVGNEEVAVAEAIHTLQKPSSPEATLAPAMFNDTDAISKDSTTKEPNITLFNHIGDPSPTNEIVAPMEEKLSVVATKSMSPILENELCKPQPEIPINLETSEVKTKTHAPPTFSIQSLDAESAQGPPILTRAELPIENSFPPTLSIPEPEPQSSPPTISVVLPAIPASTFPQKLDLTPSVENAPKLKSTQKALRRAQDKPPKLSKATETDPRPESANPPRLEIGGDNAIEVVKKEELPTVAIPAPPIFHQIQIQKHNSPNQNFAGMLQPGQPISVSIPSPQQQRTLSNMIQLSTATAIPIPANVSLAQAISSMGSITVQTTNACGTASGQTVYALHPNVNLQSHGQQSIIIPGGQKIVPIKLVTIPRQSPGQFQTIPLSSITSHSRGSPNLLEAVNIVANANAGSRSNSPKANQIQSSPLSISSVSLPGGGTGIQLVPISMASALSGSQNPVKVLVSQPVKLQHQHPQMFVKQVMMGGSGGQPGTATLRVMRPGEGIQSIKVLTQKPEIVQTIDAPIIKEKVIAPAVATPETKLKESLAITVSNNVSPPSLPEKKLESPTNSNSGSPHQKTIYKHVEDLEVLEPSLNPTNDDDFPFEADIIHDEKDLEDVLAGCEVLENGVGSPYDFSAVEEKIPPKYLSGGRKLLETGVVLSQQPEGNNSDPSSPLPVIRSSSPLYTYGNRTSKTSRSPSPAESDVHGEDQEIIDTFTRSPSQPKLSPQNRKLEEEEEGPVASSGSKKPDLIAPEISQELSIDIPQVDLMVMSPSQANQQQHEERKPARSTRSNTRLVSPDITAFRSDTPKPTKFSTKPDPLVLRNSPKPSPTGSVKMLSPTVSTGLTITPSSSNRSSPILIGQTAALNANHANSVTFGAIEKISGHINSARGVSRLVSSKRKRQESDSSSASKDENLEEKAIEIDLNSRPGKRRCSENAAELIKACIGAEDTPKRNTMLIKRMEESKLKEAKLKKAMAPLVEENEDDSESVDSILSRGRGRGSRASSEDRSSSRGSSVQRNIGPSKIVKEDENPKEKNSKSTRVGKDATKKNDQNSSKKNNGKTVPGRGVKNNTAKDKSPLTPAKARSNVRKYKEGKGVANTNEKFTGVGTHQSNSSDGENLRRQTRSTAAGEL